MDDLRSGLEAYWFEQERLENGYYNERPWLANNLQRLRAMDRKRLAGIARQAAQQLNDKAIWRLALALEQPHYHGEDPAMLLWPEAEVVLAMAAPPPPNGAPEGEECEQRYIERMRAAIAAHPNGRQAKPKTLTEGVSRSKGRRALRKLQELGEYDGFAK